MKKILIMGSGHVAGPAIHYLHQKADCSITVATNDAKGAAEHAELYPGIHTVIFNVNASEQRRQLIAAADIVISLLPAGMHPIVAADCLKYKKNMLTSSYTSDYMRDNAELIQQAGLVFVNECGLDPGIDHMTAMKMIDRVHLNGGTILEFKSYCGGLPAPEANTNPFGYKFSWNPKGVLTAGMNAAVYWWENREMKVPGDMLLLNHWPIQLPFVGDFEYYPNRNSLVYQNLYHLQKAETVFRGTLRYPGWCETMHALYQLGFNSDKQNERYQDMTLLQITSNLLDCPESKVEHVAAKKLGLPFDSIILQRLKWLGLFSEQYVHNHNFSPLGILVELMQARMTYDRDERDMIILVHEFLIREKDGTKKQIVSGFIDYGNPSGFSAMAKTVGYPLAIAAEQVLDQAFCTPGVHIPTISDLYIPVLKKLETLGIKMQIFKTVNL